MLETILLAIVQGLTEFLPVSSSGHLVLGEALFGGQLFQDSIAFEVVLHLGTFLAVILVFRQEIMVLIRVFFSEVSHPSTLRAHYLTNPDLRLTVFMVIGMLPAGLAGLFLRDWITEAFQSARLVSGTLLVTGVLLLATRFVKEDTREINAFRALLIGLAQMAALLPGISRSGSTIATAMLLGISQEKAARFSFIMVLPLILAASALELLELLKTGIQGEALSYLLVGFVVAFLAGWISLKWLLVLLEKGKFYHFAWYCFSVAILGFMFIG